MLLNKYTYIHKSTSFILSAFVIIILCCNTTPKTSTFYLYAMTEIDTIKIKKVFKTDNLFDFDNIHNKVIQYSGDSGFIIVTNTLSNTHKIIEIVKNKKNKFYHPWNFCYNYLNDSTIAFYFESYDPIVDYKIGLVNINNGKVTYPFNTELGFLLTEKNSKNEKGAKQLLKVNGVWLFPKFSKPAINKNDTTFYITLLNGKLRGINSNLRSNTNNLLVLRTKSSKLSSELLESKFSNINNVFIDSINPYLTEILYPSLSYYDKNSFLLSFEGSKDVIHYNFSDNKPVIKSIDLSYLGNTDSFLNLKNKLLKNCYLFDNIITSENSNLILRGVKMASDENSSFSKNKIYAIFNKDFESLGVTNELNDKMLLCGANNNSFYALDISRSSADSQFNYIIKFKLKPKSKLLNIENAINNKTSIIEKEKKLNEHLNRISLNLLKQDTIVTLFTSNVCPSCIHKTGIFLSELATKGINPKFPILIVSKSKEESDNFINKYKLGNLKNTYMDYSFFLLENIFFENEQGIITISSDNIKCTGYNVNQLDAYLKVIHPQIIKIDKICFPIE